MLIVFAALIVIFVLITLYACVKVAGEADEIAENEYKMWEERKDE